MRLDKSARTDNNKNVTVDALRPSTIILRCASILPQGRELAQLTVNCNVLALSKFHFSKFLLEVLITGYPGLITRITRDPGLIFSCAPLSASAASIFSQTINQLRPESTIICRFPSIGGFPVFINHGLTDNSALNNVGLLVDWFYSI